MSLWKKTTRITNEQLSHQIDIQQLRKRLANITEQNSLEIIKIALQSIIDELDER